VRKYLPLALLATAAAKMTRKKEVGAMDEIK